MPEVIKMEKPKIERVVKLVKSNGEAEATGGAYFDPPDVVECFSSGAQLLDLVLGGKGWAENRVSTIVGSESTGKSLLCIEACANFANKYKKGLLRYCETEAAFDEPYAQSVGLPEDRVEMNKGDLIDTIEGVNEELEKFIAECQKKKTNGLFVLDSLDAVSDKDEKEGEFGKASYGGLKAKLITQMFRRNVQAMRESKVTMILTAQAKEKVGVVFGDKDTFSGGKAPKFFSSQIVWLNKLENVEEVKKGAKRKVGIWTRIKCKKNKIGPAWRECDLMLRYGYGVDDILSSLTWLTEMDMLGELNFALKKDEIKEFMEDLAKCSDEAYLTDKKIVTDTVDKCWKTIEKRFAPTRRKY